MRLELVPTRPKARLWVLVHNCHAKPSRSLLAPNRRPKLSVLNTLAPATTAADGALQNADKDVARQVALAVNTPRIASLSQREYVRERGCNRPASRCRRGRRTQESPGLAQRISPIFGSYPNTWPMQYPCVPVGMRIRPGTMSPRQSLSHHINYRLDHKRRGTASLDNYQQCRSSCPRQQLCIAGCVRDSNKLQPFRVAPGSTHCRRFQPARAGCRPTQFN